MRQFCIADSLDVAYSRVFYEARCFFCCLLQRQAFFAIYDRLLHHISKNIQFCNAVGGSSSNNCNSYFLLSKICAVTNRFSNLGLPKCRRFVSSSKRRSLLRALQINWQSAKRRPIAMSQRARRTQRARRLNAIRTRAKASERGRSEQSERRLHHRRDKRSESDAIGDSARPLSVRDGALSDAIAPTPTTRGRARARARIT